MTTVKKMKVKLLQKGTGKEYKRMNTIKGKMDNQCDILEYRVNVIDEICKHSEINKKYLTKENELEYLTTHTQILQTIINAESIEALNYIKDKGIKILDNILNHKYS